MDISPAHEAARAAAIRLPALQASLALLIEDSQRARISLYADPPPTAPGDPPSSPAVVVIDLAATAGTIDAELYQLHLDTPVEGQITGADPVDGTPITWARVEDGRGDWWGDVTVSETGGAGAIQLDSTLLYQGAFV